MKQMLSCLVIVLALTLFPVPSSQAADCAGGWNKMPNYTPGRGGPCQILGLNSRAGVCQPGYEYETLCDDASGGRYKTCQGPRRCSGSGGDRSVPPQNHDCTEWDYKHDRVCPSGYVNNDCRGTCESLAAPSKQNNCTAWDYDRNRPCPVGYINRDCRGGCGPR